MRVAWFSPTYDEDKEKSSRSAYVTEKLLVELNKKYQLTLFRDSFSQNYKGVNSTHYLNAITEHKKDPFDLFFYQVEDHRSSRFLLSHLGTMPGFVWFHDILFRSDPPEPLILSRWSAFLRDFSGCKLPETDRDDPFSFREAFLSAVPIFSNPWAHGEYVRRTGKVKVFESFGLNRSYYLPMPIETEAQNTLPAEFTLSACLSSEVQDHAFRLLYALRKLSFKYKLKWALPKDQWERAKELCSEFGVTNFELFPLSSWEDICEKSNVAVHIKNTVYGNLDPYLGISLAKGIPSIVTDFGESGPYLSNEEVLKVRSGPDEGEQLFNYLRALFDKPFINSESISNLIVRSSKNTALEIDLIIQNNLENYNALQTKWQSYKNNYAQLIKNEILSKQKDAGLNYNPFKEGVFGGSNL